MQIAIGIRREDKNRWERRVPIIPEHVADLINKHNIGVLVQKSDLRIIREEEFIRAGAEIAEDMSPCAAIFGIKEIPVQFIQKGKTYVFFSHTIKGQAHNMPLLGRIMELGCQLIDYEKMMDEKGRRLVFFGKHAGLAGMIDSLWALGKKLEWEKVPNPFSAVKQTIEYRNLADADKSLAEIGKQLASGGLPDIIAPVIIGFAGYGNVSLGAQKILENFPVEEIKPERLASFFRNSDRDKIKTRIFKVVFREEHMVKPVSPDDKFELQDYYLHPEKYKSRFEEYIPYLTVIVNAVYWDAKYPRLVTKDYLKKLYSGQASPKLKVIGDISCDINGAIECNAKIMNSGNPVFVYNPLTTLIKDGCGGTGPVILSVDNLPAELPEDSSREFSRALISFAPEIAKADMSVSFEECALPETIKKAIIVYQGKLTPDYRYLAKFVAPADSAYGGISAEDKPKKN
ncbi:MAG: bifunctional lysine ketoglutarate reductase /saccharopine dehydrogenase family protein [Elusimicrobia bacterium]|nr:bifunctional lysine ketoglutarate reductase /saccharopine dehydrogenase family protein [Elusimicrobiota bacterium]